RWRCTAASSSRSRSGSRWRSSWGGLADQGRERDRCSARRLPAPGRPRGRARLPDRAPPALAIPAMAVVGTLAGYCFAVSLRVSSAGLSVAPSLLIAQALPLDAADALPALLCAGGGGLPQALFSLLVYAAGDREEEGGAGRLEHARSGRRTALQPRHPIGQRPSRAAP